MKNFFAGFKTYIYVNRNIIFLAIPFILMDLSIRILGYEIEYYPPYYLVPNVFTLIWIILFIGVVISLKGIFSKIAYWLIFGIFFIFFLVNIIYYSFTSFYFNFNVLKMASEGSSYILDVILGTNPFLYFLGLIILVIAIFAFKKMPVSDKFNFKNLSLVFLMFIVTHIFTPQILGPSITSLEWDNFKKSRVIYDTFSDYNKSMKVAGLYEYIIRDFYITFLKPEENISADDEEFLNKIYSSNNTSTQNQYTGIFKDKNLIFLQLEGVDDWMFTEADMPNLYSMLNNSIIFSDHYSMYTGGGSTFNSEFAVNTGFISPVTYQENVYTLNTNHFPYTMAKLFKKLDYTVNAFHMNTADFYSRGVNYKSWGYDNYFGLLDVKKYNDNQYMLDRELILNETFYENLFTHDGPFVDYIITFSPHTPFTTEEMIGEMLAKEKYEGMEIPNLSEEECVRMATSETDNMVGLLLQALKDNNLYDNTVIVVFTDHYLYTLEDKTILDKYKETDSNLINHTPFFIWSNDISSTTIDKTTMQSNILPTVLNLFGIEHNSNHYIGKDALAPDYDGFAFFPDHSWYNGEVYIENDKITNNSTINNDRLNTLNSMINNAIRQNDLTLKYNYFKRLE